MEAVPHRRTNDAAFPTLSLAELKPIWAGTTARRTRSGPLKTRGGMVPITRDMNAYSPGSPFGSTRTHAAEHEKWARRRSAARCVWRVQVTKLILPNITGAPLRYFLPESFHKCEVFLQELIPLAGALITGRLRARRSPQTEDGFTSNKAGDNYIILVK